MIRQLQDPGQIIIPGGYIINHETLKDPITRKAFEMYLEAINLEVRKQIVKERFNERDPNKDQH